MMRPAAPNARRRGRITAWVCAGALAGAALLSACRPKPADCERPDVVCAGLVTDYGTVLSGVNREAWLALQDAQSARLVDRIDFIATVDSRDRLLNIRALADQGYDIIITTGAGMADETLSAARRYPKLKFIGIEQSQPEKLPNLAGLVFHEDYSGFVAGVLAARLTSTGRVAALCEAQFIDAMRRYCEGFRAGVRYADAGVEDAIVYRDGPSETLMNDPEWGRSTALKQVADGADVLFAAGGATAQAALEAAASESTYVIGSGTDVYRDLPGIRPHLLTSTVSNVRANLVEILTLSRQGKFPAGDYMGSEGLAPWHDLDRQVPLEVKQEMERLFVRLELGVIELDIPYKKTK